MKLRTRNIFYPKYSGARLTLNLDQKIAWPEKGQNLFVEPSGSTPSEVSAHLSWLGSELMMPEAYKQGADFMVEALRLGGDGTHPDRFTFPILYLYRHATELRLKEIIIIGLRLGLEQESAALTSIRRKHVLLPLWDRVKAILEQVWPNTDGDELAVMESMIKELHLTDRDGQHLRYPHGNDGKPFEHHLPERVDLLNVRTVFEGLWNFLGGSIDGLMYLEDCQP